ncbi:hypothetical protein LJB99_02860 [Deltaproteobacteria bacterium OttesenSCG-928-K17]|nr:hypothetical protein [Deltaproteobacteria bacterium OttesenSCG-928-K17]
MNQMENRETDPIVLPTPNDLANLITDPSFHPSQLNRVQCGAGFNLDFRIRGDLWRGQLDAKAGQFVFQLQRDIFTLYRKTTGEILDYRIRNEVLSDFLIEADLKTGSSWFNIDLSKIATNLVKKVSGTQLTILGMTLLVGWFAKDFVVSYNDHIVTINLVEKIIESNKDFAEMQKDNNQTVRQIYSESLNALGETTTSFRELLKYADDQNDQITFVVSGKEETASAHVIKTRLPQPVPQESKIKTFRGWADFTITRQNHVARTFYMTSDGIPALKRAEISLDGGRLASDEFYRDIAHQLSEGKVPSLRLEVLVRMNDHGIVESATIISRLPSGDDHVPTDIKPLQSIFGDEIEQTTGDRTEPRLF